MTDRLDKIKARAANDWMGCVRVEVEIDCRYLLTRLEAAEAVVEAAKEYGVDCLDTAQTGNWQQKWKRLQNTLAAYDKVKGD